ncbi:uncharacterized protein [Solanum lycopersicum]|uniref:uncharacterized protein n=1 Tax=Solanum lycopersicum TaxID=4081 RepID=UPI003748F22C
MDFITGLPRTQQKYDSIWDIVDRLKKLAHFLPVTTTYSPEDYARLYVREIVRLHGVPTSIISGRGTQFTANFWRSFQKGLGTQVKLIQERLLAVQSRQESYVDNRRRDLAFQIGDWVFLKVSPMRGVMRFGRKGKLSLRYFWPYHIVRRIGKVAYELDRPSDLEAVHPFFHVSMLRICISDPYRVFPVDDVQVTEELSYEEKPVAILDCRVRRLCTKDVASLKVLWQNNNREEMTWEAEDEMKNKYPYLFPVPTSNSIPSLTILIYKRDYVVSCNPVRNLYASKESDSPQKGKSVAEGNSQTRRSCATPPPPKELRAAAAPVRGTRPAPEAPAPEPPSP